VERVGKEKGRQKFRPGEDSVKAMTMHSSKGLEFPVVAIPGLGFMPQAKSDVREEAKLLYVGMTRAMDQLLLTCHKESDFVNRIRNATQTGVVRDSGQEVPIAPPQSRSRRSPFSWLRRPS
jgi:superfamily I DNA/RNA helicase